MFANKSERSFFIASAVCLGVALALFGGLLAMSSSYSHAGPVERATTLGGGIVLLALAAWLFVWPARMQHTSAALLTLPAAFEEARSQLVDLVTLRKEYHKMRTDMEGYANQLTQALAALQTSFQHGHHDLDVRQQVFDQLAQALQQNERTAIELRQAKGDAVRQTEAWQQATLQFLRLLERASDPESGLEASYRQAATQLTDDYLRELRPLGLQALRPTAGERFDERIHEYAGGAPSETVPVGQILACCEWGFVLGEVVVAKAQVILAQAPTPTTTTNGAAA